MSLPKNFIIESCVESVEEAKYAFYHGATQLEICSHLEDDGLTPSIELVKKIISCVNIPCKVMIRCRKGDFFYTNEEILAMAESIQMLKSLPIEGFVFGALSKDNMNNITLDKSALIRICKCAYPLPLTVHKAIDVCDDIVAEVKSLAGIMKVKYILTSGGAATAAEGAAKLKEMDSVSGNITIIAAGKITASNLEALIQTTGLRAFHGRKIV